MRHPSETAPRIAIFTAIVCLGAMPARAQAIPDSGSRFARMALSTLPIEEPQGFREILMGETDRLRRDPSTKPISSEMTIPDDGWELLIASKSGLLLRQTASEFSRYLDKSMKVRVKIDERPSLADWSTVANAIVVGSREQLPGCGARLQSKKDYRIVTSPKRIVVCGFDERGTMYGLYNLQSRFNLREGPYLPRALDTTRRSLYKMRMTLSGLGWLDFPDWYLQQLAQYGFDAIYAPAYHNLNGYPRKQPEGLYASVDAERLRDLIRRAAKYGIDLYSPILWLYTGEPENELELRMLVRDVVKSFPEIRGYVLLNTSLR